MNTLTVPTDFAQLLQLFFLQRLIQQRHVSHRTVTSYRDTFRLLLRFAQRWLDKPASELSRASTTSTSQGRTSLMP